MLEDLAENVEKSLRRFRDNTCTSYSDRATSANGTGKPEVVDLYRLKNLLSLYADAFRTANANAIQAVRITISCRISVLISSKAEVEDKAVKRRHQEKDGAVVSRATTSERGIAGCGARSRKIPAALSPDVQKEPTDLRYYMSRDGKRLQFKSWAREGASDPARMVSALKQAEKPRT